MIMVGSSQMDDPGQGFKGFGVYGFGVFRSRLLRFHWGSGFRFRAFWGLGC